MILVVGSTMEELTSEAQGSERMELLPLNFQRITAVMVRRLACALEIPTSGTTEDVRQLLDAKLAERGYKPMKVQVKVSTGLDGVTLYLEDAEGTFLEVRPEGKESPEASVEQGDENLPEQSEESLQQALQAALSRNKELTEELQAAREDLDKARVESQARRNRVEQLWQVSCDRLAVFDAALLAKDREISLLRQMLTERSPGPTASSGTVPSELPSPNTDAGISISDAKTPPKARKGKVPPVELFTGEDPEFRLDDWLPSLHRAAQWNGWSTEEQLIQLAGHLKGRALQEWNLLGESQTQKVDEAIQALRERLDPGSKVLAGQDFLHTAQHEAESVADFVRHLERTFHVAYGRDKMSVETKEAILFGQLQEGLRIELLCGPAVSGALGYKELCEAAKSEERRLSELKKRQTYLRQSNSQSGTTPKPTSGTHPPAKKADNTRSSTQLTCYHCGKLGHIAKDCRMRKSTESPRRPSTTTAKGGRTPGARRIGTVKSKPEEQSDQGKTDDPTTYLYSSDESDEVR